MNKETKRKILLIFLLSDVMDSIVTEVSQETSFALKKEFKTLREKTNKIRRFVDDTLPTVQIQEQFGDVSDVVREKIEEII